MPNDPFGPTAEGMPTAPHTMTRRLFLGRAVTIAPLAAVPALAAPAAQVRSENPALLALLPEIEKAGKTFATAEGAYQSARKAGHALWPRAPRIIREERMAAGGDLERDIEGHGYSGGYISTSALVAMTLDAVRTGKGAAAAAKRKALEAELEAARAYEAACETARGVSGFPGAEAKRAEAMRALEALVRRTADEDAYTMEGVRIKAKAILYWNGLPFVFRAASLITGDPSQNLAAAILDVLEPAA